MCTLAARAADSYLFYVLYEIYQFRMEIEYHQVSHCKVEHKPHGIYLSSAMLLRPRIVMTTTPAQLITHYPAIK